MIKYIIKIIFLLIANTSANALTPHEFSLFGSGGISTLNFRPTIGDHRPGFGGKFGFNYTYFFSGHWALKTGVGVAFHSATFRIDDLQTRYMAFDDIEDIYFEFRSQKTNFRERQFSTMLQIPLMLQREIFLRNAFRQLYFSTGFKVGIPLSGRYRTTIERISNSGFYKFEYNEYTNFEEVGFHNITNFTAEGDLNFNLAFFASAEVGMRWWLRSGNSIYTAVFFDFGLNNIVETGRAPSPQPITEHNLLAPVINNIFDSHHTQNTTQQSFVNSVRPMAVGITLRFMLNREF